MHLKYFPSPETPAGPVAIVHIGLGAFMRAHLAVYTEQVRQQGGEDWGICAANIRSNHQIVDQLKQQHCRYHVAECASSTQLTCREISAIREVLYAGDGQGALLLQRIQDLQIRIVSLTVTEKGYFLNPADGVFQAEHPAIVQDLQQPASPSTAIGIIVRALQYRFENALPAFTPLSCDNMPDNGKSLKKAVLAFAALVDATLAAWIADKVSFPATMVDRIVPAMTGQSLAQVNALLKEHAGLDAPDQAAVACEQFSQWVIEDKFCAGRPDWQLAGAQFVEDVAPYEDMKLRMLNGSHSLLAYLGYLGGLEYVADCMNEPEYVAMIRYYLFSEAAPTLNMPAGVNLGDYARSLLERFSNDSLKHRTAQIAMDGSVKIPQRWLTGIDVLLAKGTVPEIGALGLAAWLRYVSGKDEQGNAYLVNDPRADEFAAIFQQTTDQQSLLKALLGTSVFAGAGCAKDERFIARVSWYYQQLLDKGARETVHALVANFQVA